MAADAPPRYVPFCWSVPKWAGWVAALLALVFVLLGRALASASVGHFDVYWLQASQVWRLASPGLAGVMRDLSGLGSTVVLTLVTVMAVVYLLIIGAWRTAVLMAGAALSGTYLVSVSKAVFSRLRPDAAYADMALTSYSFPSGHASMSAVVFLMLGALCASTRQRRAERVAILSAAAVIVLLVGLSRVVLGVHWATDVLGGWAFGMAWALGGLWLAGRLARR